MSNTMPTCRRIGVVGYGNLGKFLVDEIQQRPDVELAFVWNRTVTALEGCIPPELILSDLNQFHSRNADLIVEVSHPKTCQEYGSLFLEHADFMIGSPSAMADRETETKLTSAATKHGLYIPAGALWGGEDIRKMADRGTLQAVKISMSKTAESINWLGGEIPKEVTTVLYDGPVRELCCLAPNNVNTMAAACIAAHNLGFDQVQGSLIADPSVYGWHVIELDVWGPGDIAAGTAFHTKTVRRNPAKHGAVTGTATYNPFLSSMLRAVDKGSGVHLC